MAKMAPTMIGKGDIPFFFFFSPSGTVGSAVKGSYLPGFLARTSGSMFGVTGRLIPEVLARIVEGGAFKTKNVMNSC